MCGICGIAYRKLDVIPPASLLSEMCQQLIHRGPDERRLHREPSLGMGFQRLSIIDRLGGHQPISNEDETLWLSCNGEIYNYLELRGMLLTKGHRFATQSDVEVIVHPYEEEGEAFITHLRGMFALALWDRKQRKLILARDQLGIKPLYYAELPGSLVFASEIKSLLSGPKIRPSVEPDALHSYLTFRYVPAPATLFKGIKKVRPAHYLIYCAGRLTERSYWDLPIPEESSYSEEEYTEKLLDLLRETVKLHLQSEVPLGIFLGGGIDSSTILAMAANGLSNRLNTFSLGFVQDGAPHVGFWELDATRRVARDLSSYHREIEVSPQEIPQTLATMVWYLEEPLGDPSIIPLYFICQAASREVTVVLSGEGADELFGGYEIYFAPRAIERFQSLPGFIRNRLIMPLARQLPPGFPGRNFVQRACAPVEGWYRGVGFTFSDEEKETLYTAKMRHATADIDLRDITSQYFPRPEGLHPLERMLYFDTKLWLADDTLLKADKLSMAHSLELRVPFLDHKVVEFAASLQANLKVKDKTLKYILKKAADKILPREVIQRRKLGFTAPITSWITSELRPYAETLLASPRFLDRGYFRAESVKRLLTHGRRISCVHSRQIYTLMILELWHRLFIDGEQEILVLSLSRNESLGALRVTT